MQCRVFNDLGDSRTTDSNESDYISYQLLQDNS